MCKALVTKLGVDFNDALPQSVLDDLAGTNPRECKVRLEAAIAIGLARGRSKIDMECWRQTNRNASIPKGRMGFV